MRYAELAENNAKGTCLTDYPDDISGLTKCFCIAAANRVRREADALRGAENARCQATANHTLCRETADQIQNKSDNESKARVYRDQQKAQATYERDNQKTLWNYVKCTDGAYGDYWVCSANYYLGECEGVCYATWYGTMKTANIAYDTAMRDASAAFFYDTGMAESDRLYKDSMAFAAAVFACDGAQVRFNSQAAMLSCAWASTTKLAEITRTRTIANLDCEYPTLPNDPEDPDVVAYNTACSRAQDIYTTQTTNADAGYWRDHDAANATRNDVQIAANNDCYSTYALNEQTRNRITNTAASAIRTAMDSAYADLDITRCDATQKLYNCIMNLTCNRGS